mgnify:CR=1 FL=1
MLRIFDFLFSLFGLILGGPALLVIYVIGLFDTGSPIFRQERVGRNQKPFTLVKFRTMRPDTASVASHLADASAITPLGAFLRRTKLDELPQLLNVLKGEMSLVGPRPLLMEYLPLYTSEQARRHEVRPGVTGWAQINGCRGEVRTHEEMEQRVNFDLYYIHRWSFTLDLQIILQTIIKMLRDKGAY